MARITGIQARQILDSRGNPTIEADVFLEDGTMGRAAVPSGASTGTYEAVELRDDEPRRYGGLSVRKAVANVDDIIAPKIIGMDSAEQGDIDATMIALDGTENKSRLGANALLSVSLAAAAAHRKSARVPLFRHLATLGTGLGCTARPLMPRPMFNIVNGGKHAPDSTDIQEYLIIPHQHDFSDQLRCGAEVFHALKQLLVERGMPSTVGDEGGFAPRFSTNREPFDFILAAIGKAGYRAGADIGLGIDVAAGELYDAASGTYVLKRENKSLSPDEMRAYLLQLTYDYPLISIEDPLEQNDFEGFAQFTKAAGPRLQIIGDDLFATNTKRLQKGIEMKSATAILIKPNQIGTLTETMLAIVTAQKNGMQTVVSHRSGETEDTFIADLSVGLGAGQIKAGSLSRSERLAKYNQLIRIEEQLRTYVSPIIR